MKKWTKEMLDELVDLLKQGKSYEELGIIFNKTYNSIRSVLYQNDIKITDYIEFEKHKIKNCLECGNEITGYKKFCDRSCSAKYNNKIRKKDLFCLNCGKLIVGKNATKYCCHICQWEYKKKNQIEKWKNGDSDGVIGSRGATSKIIRKYIFEKYDNKCARCGWNEINPYTNKIPLQLEHIDGNYKNNDEKNLTLLCPSCHSLTSTYGARNKGNGRPRYNQS